MKQLFLAACLLVVGASALHSDYLRVTLNHGGGVTGKYMTSASGRGIRAFTGIPYAEAPVGNYRFQDSVPKQGWNGYFNQRYYDNVICPQFDTYTRSKHFQGQEDCLYLNIYVPMVRHLCGIISRSN